MGNTVASGDAAAVFYGNGEVDVIHGPRRVLWTCGRRFQPLERSVASENEYLKLKFKNGRTELQPGPVSMFCHPTEHESVTCHPAVTLRDQELIVVYRKSDETEPGTVKRELVQGPGLYIPSSVCEWVHEFSWTGPATRDEDVNAPARKVPNAVKKSKLLLIPGKMYYDVEGVRTKDNAMITVKLMIFYRLAQVEVMLDNTNDPMADMINAVTADIIEWCAPKDFSDFLAETDSLNTMNPYSQLQATAQKIGYALDKVVFRGYAAPASLQRMHDSAIEKRTALCLAKESEEEEQALADFKLQRNADRAAKEQELEMQKLEHDLAMKRMSAELQREQQKMDHAIEFERLKAIRSLDGAGDTAMAQYLVAKDCQMPPVVQCATMLSPPGSGLNPNTFQPGQEGWKLQG
eukprot:TRINITY_DN92495_c0_g1_i1.p1 TRINITY_DN92495_c0_g1~~TRINITY_DN92495_c0_g1_i1.p1  ORF type:complete len:430 (-),score=99.27 TRINITY_DN92495_c0_g1_i1:25-1242(-)